MDEELEKREVKNFLKVRDDHGLIGLNWNEDKGTFEIPSEWEISIFKRTITHI